MKMPPFMVFVSVDLLSMNRNTMLCHFGGSYTNLSQNRKSKSSGYLFFRFWLHCNRQLNIACRALCCQCEFMLHRNVALCSLTIITTISNFILSQCHHVVVLIHFLRQTVIYIFQLFLKLFFIEKYTSVQKASQKYFCSFFHFSTFWLIFFYSAAA